MHGVEKPSRLKSGNGGNSKQMQRQRRHRYKARNLTKNMIVH